MKRLQARFIAVQLICAALFSSITNLAAAQIGSLRQVLPISATPSQTYTFLPNSNVIFNSAATPYSSSPNVFAAGYCTLFPCGQPSTALNWTFSDPLGLGLGINTAVNDPVSGKPALNVFLLTSRGHASGSTIAWGIEEQVRIPLLPPYTSAMQSDGSVLTIGKRYQVSAVVSPQPGSVAGLLRIGIGDWDSPDSGVRTFLIAPAGTAAPVGTKAVSCTSATAGGPLTCGFSFIYQQRQGGTPNTQLFLIPQTAGMNVYIDSITITEVDADPLNLAADAPRPPNLSGTYAVGNTMEGLKFGQWDFNGGVWPTALGVNMIRLWDTGTYWAALQPVSSGSWAPEVINVVATWANGAYQNAAGTILTLGLSPTWAIASPADCYPANANNSNGGTAYTAAAGTSVTSSSSVLGCFLPPDEAHLQAWQSYVQTSAEQLGKRVRYFELWNEPDILLNSTGGGGELATLARYARQGLSQAHTSLAKAGVSATLSLVGPSTTNAGMDYMDQFFAAGGGAYVDVISYHAYFPALNTEDGAPAMNLENVLSATASNVRLAMKDYGLSGKPLWNTEGAPDCTARTNTGCQSMARPSTDALRGLQLRAVATMYLNGVSNFDYYDLEGTVSTTPPWNALATPNPTPASVPAGFSGAQYTIPTDTGIGFSIAGKWLAGSVIGGTSAKATPQGWPVFYQGHAYPVYVMPLRNQGVQQYLMWNYSASPICVQVPAGQWGLNGWNATNGYLAKVHTTGVNPIGTTLAGPDVYSLAAPSYAPKGALTPAAQPSSPTSSTPMPSAAIWLMPYSPVLLTPN